MCVLPLYVFDWPTCYCLQTETYVVIEWYVIGENRMIDRCVRKDSSRCDPSRITRDRRLLSLWPQPYHPRPQTPAVSPETTKRGVHPHAPVNHTVFFLCHGFIKFMYINKILMKTKTLIFVYYMLQCELLCVPTSGSGFYLWSGFCQWVWILSVGLDFASGSGYENPMSQTPCCIMWSTHNHGIKTRKLVKQNIPFNTPTDYFWSILPLTVTSQLDVKW